MTLRLARERSYYIYTKFLRVDGVKKRYYIKAWLPLKANKISLDDRSPELLIFALAQPSKVLDPNLVTLV